MILIWCNFVFIPSNKNKVVESLFEATEFLLKHIPTKWMNGLKAISVNKDLIKPGTMLH